MQSSHGGQREVAVRVERAAGHLVILLEQLRAVGVQFVSLNEGIDATTPAGKLQLHILAALAEFERERIAACVAFKSTRYSATNRSCLAVSALLIDTTPWTVFSSLPCPRFPVPLPNHDVPSTGALGLVCVVPPGLQSRRFQPIQLTA